MTREAYWKAQELDTKLTKTYLLKTIVNDNSTLIKDKYGNCLCVEEIPIELIERIERVIQTYENELANEFDNLDGNYDYEE